MASVPNSKLLETWHFASSRAVAARSPPERCRPTNPHRVLLGVDLIRPADKRRNLRLKPPLLRRHPPVTRRLALARIGRDMELGKLPDVRTTRGVRRSGVTRLRPETSCGASSQRDFALVTASGKTRHHRKEPELPKINLAEHSRSISADPGDCHGGVPTRRDCSGEGRPPNSPPEGPTP